MTQQKPSETGAPLCIKGVTAAIDRRRVPNLLYKARVIPTASGLCEERSQYGWHSKPPCPADTLRIRNENSSIDCSNLIWRCKTTRKTRSSWATVRLPSINAQMLERFTFTRKHARKNFREHEISQQASFIPRPTTVDATHTKLRHGSR